MRRVEQPPESKYRCELRAPRFFVCRNYLMTHHIGSACRKRVPLCFAVAIALGCVGARAATFTTVTNCADDNSPGTLRATLGALAPSDNNAIVDVSSCAAITLTQGELTVPLSIAILGPPSGTTTIDANHLGRVFENTGELAGTGNLILTNITIRGGRVNTTTQIAEAGCIAASSVTLNGSVVTDCSVHSDSASAGGGAISAFTVTLYRSSVVSNSADSGSQSAFGGAILANRLSCTQSTVGDSQASGRPAKGGGVAVYGASTFDGCTIAANAADEAAGVFARGGAAAADVLTVVNSTISGNQASTLDGGIFSGGPLILRNSTITNNRAAACAGARVERDAQIDSSIVARNISVGPACVDLVAYGVITGAHDLIGVDNGGLPAGTLVADPHLAPLADHGGYTRTHALLATSPAIDAGSNIGGVPTDQRGSGFTRQAGASPDIGAYERQPNDDELFYDGLEGSQQ
jgi:hypothetical protein